jgi:hypothetical protein
MTTLSKEERKKDLRAKIMMGGLIVKSGLSFLHEDHNDVLFGLLLDAKDRLTDKDYEEYCRKLGEETFVQTKAMKLAEQEAKKIQKSSRKDSEENTSFVLTMQG